jgi:hypothetical protein
MICFPSKKTAASRELNAILMCVKKRNYPKDDSEKSAIK